MNHCQSNKAACRVPGAALAILVPLCFCFGRAALAAPPTDPTYWQDIRPILRKNCTVCHSTKNLKELDVSGGLALDSYAAVRKGTKYAVIEPGKSSDSVLVQRLLSEDDDKRMP